MTGYKSKTPGNTLSTAAFGRVNGPFWENALNGAAGAVLGISILKFGNPVIFESMIGAPTNVLEYLFQPWPVAWGYLFTGVVAVLSLKAGTLRVAVPRWIVVLPAVWFGWQLLSSTQSVSPALSRATLWHFAAAIGWFYIGLFALGQSKSNRIFWMLLLAAFAWVLWSGVGQHYGGLEAARQMVYEQPGWRELPPLYLKRIASDRIFSTLVYPNAFAGLMLLLLPPLMPFTWELTRRLPRVARLVCTGFLAYVGLACLVWTGSKAGWLIALIVGMAAWCFVPISRRVKAVVLLALMVAGLGGFWFKYASYFEKGATSVGARFDYWEAAFTTALDNPILGTGPGTFAVPYAKIKAPDAEMARLVHNDYLEQASDSGAVGFVVYGAFVVASMVLVLRRMRARLDDPDFPIWLGLLAWTLHAMVEFALYIPALAWPAFALFGILLAGCCRKEPSGDTVRHQTAD